MVAGMRLVTVKMPEFYLDGLDELVKMGRFSSRSEAIRVAVRELLMRELWRPQKRQPRVILSNDIVSVKRREDEGDGGYLAVALSDEEYGTIERLARAKGVTVPELLAHVLKRYLEHGVEA